MPTVPAGFIVGLPDALSIPAGWVREESLDDLHVKGAAGGADPGILGGVATHTHASAHSHTVPAHQHAGGTSGGGSGIAASTSGATSGAPIVGHTHSIPTTGMVAATLSATTAAVFGASANDPPYVTIRWIRSLGIPAGIPVGAWTYWDAAALPAVWSSPVAARTKYLKGAAPGATGGGTGGSSSAHTHAGAPHTHSFAAHTHTGGTSGALSGSYSVQLYTTVPVMMGFTHTHAVTVVAAPVTTASGSQTSAPTGSTAAEPPFVILGIIQNDNASPNFPVGVIGLWLGLLSAIPASLHACDGTGGTVDTRGKFVKGADISGANFTGIGTTGGATTHDHTDPATHTHSANHQHTLTLGSDTGGIAAQYGALMASPRPHTHVSVLSGTGGGGVSGSAAQTVDVANNEPLNRTAVFVKYTGSIDVTVTAPTEGQEYVAPTINLTWTISAGTQANKRILIYAADQSTLVFDSGVIVDATLSYTLPAGAGLRTGQTYYVQVAVTNNSALPGASVPVSFTTAWTPPAMVTGITSTPIGGT